MNPHTVIRLGKAKIEGITGRSQGVSREHLVAYHWVGNGCPPKDRLTLCKAFIAKAVWDFPTTRDLSDAVRHRPTLRRLCGGETLGEIPCGSV